MPGLRPASRPVRLLKALVAFGGAEVPEWKLADALWPDAEADAAQHALEVTLSRLRALLGDKDAISQRERRISLEPTRCRVDAIELERRMARGSPPSQAAGAHDALARLMSLYRGSFLPEDEGDWVSAARERLRRRVRASAEALERSLERGGEAAQAHALACELARRDDRLALARGAGVAETVA